jgi:hypothetical protein
VKKISYLCNNMSPTTLPRRHELKRRSKPSLWFRKLWEPEEMLTVCGWQLQLNGCLVILSVCLSRHFVSLFVCLSICLSLCLPVPRSLCLSVCLFLSMSVCGSVCLRSLIVLSNSTEILSFATGNRLGFFFWLALMNYDIMTLMTFVIAKEF